MGLIGWALGLGVFVLLGLVFWNNVQIKKKVRLLTQASKDLARGRPTRIPWIRCPRDLSQLAGALDDLSQSLYRQLSEIQKETAHLDSILSNMTEGVITLDENGRLSSINTSAQALFGVDPARDNGRPLLEVIRNGNLGDLARSVLETGIARYQEIPFLLPEEKVFQVHAGPLVVNERTQGALLVLHDITELKRLERMRRDFVANVSHELRTPLASIEGFTETLLDGALNDPAHNREFVETIQTQAKTLRRLIDDLLDLSAIESGKRPPEKKLVDLAQVLRDVIATLQPKAKLRTINISIKTPVRMSLEADAGQLYQVFVNLLDNAIKFNSEGGTVTMSARTADRQCVIEVKDTGAGIPEKDLPRIFERFYRVDKARSRELGGTGLGLSIVKHIVEAHGGQLQVESTEGRGSTFRVTLPV